MTLIILKKEDIMRKRLHPTEEEIESILTSNPAKASV